MKDLLDYVIKNKYVIICVTLVVILYALGVIEFFTKAIILFLLVGCAIFIGKKMQDNENMIKHIFNFKFVRRDDFNAKYNEKDNVYYYQDNNDK